MRDVTRVSSHIYDNKLVFKAKHDISVPKPNQPEHKSNVKKRSSNIFLVCRNIYSGDRVAQISTKAIINALYCTLHLFTTYTVIHSC